MNTSVAIGGHESFPLLGAILVYRGNRCFATWHSAKESDKGTPYLGEAQPLRMDFVKAFLQGLSIEMQAEILPRNVLVCSADSVVWWTQATSRTMFLRETDESVEPLTGRRFPHPPLVWKVSGHELWVRALKRNARPGSETQLFVAPYWNVNGEDGLTCQGSMRSPEDAGVGSVAEWERAFFQSEFTHATGVRPLTNHPGGFVGLWTSLADSTKAFPANRLVPAKQTLLEFVQEA